MVIECLLKGVTVSSVKREVEVEEDKTVASVILAAIGLDIVLGPVIVAQIQFCSHVVGKLIHVQQTSDFLVGFCVGTIACYLTESVVSRAGAVVKSFVLEHVDFLIIIAEVGIDKLVVRGLAQV